MPQLQPNDDHLHKRSRGISRYRKRSATCLRIISVSAITRTLWNSLFYSHKLNGQLVRINSFDLFSVRPKCHPEFIPEVEILPLTCLHNPVGDVQCSSLVGLPFKLRGFLCVANSWNVACRWLLTLWSHRRCAYAHALELHAEVLGIDKMFECFLDGFVCLVALRWICLVGVRWSACSWPRPSTTLLSFIGVFVPSTKLYKYQLLKQNMLFECIVRVLCNQVGTHELFAWKYTDYPISPQLQSQDDGIALFSLIVLTL